MFGDRGGTLLGLITLSKNEAKLENQNFLQNTESDTNYKMASPAGNRLPVSSLLGYMCITPRSLSLDS